VGDVPQRTIMVVNGTHGMGGWLFFLFFPPKFSLFIFLLCLSFCSFSSRQILLLTLSDASKLEGQSQIKGLWNIPPQQLAEQIT
jgi:hypothetical protein